jgi:urease accessory protein
MSATVSASPAHVRPTAQRCGMEGHLHLVCARDRAGRNHLRRQSFRAPIHFSKPYHDEDVLVVQVVQSTAGLLGGDQLMIDAEVESGARMRLTAPGATRALAMPESGATIEQRFQVASGGWFESCAPLVIPHAGAQLAQKTRLIVETGAEALLFETIAPGRVAAGELFSYASLDWTTEIVLDATLIARERYRIERGSLALEAPRAAWTTPYFGSCFVISARLDPAAECWASIHRLHGPDAWVGCSALTAGGWSIRAVAAGSLALRRVMEAVRGAIYAALRCPAPRRRGAS